MGTSSVTETEEAKPETAASIPLLTRKQKIARNCKRWWWIWLIAVLLFILVIIIIVIYAIIPAVAQKKLDATELELHSFTISDPTPKQMTVSMNATIDTGGGIASHAKLDAMDVSLSLEGTGDDEIKPFLTIPIPRTEGGDYVNIDKRDYQVNIEDMAALDGFASALMDLETMRVAMRGRTKLWLGKIHTMVNYNEVITIKGLNKLKGMAIKSYDLLNEPNANMGGKVLIPNPSPITLEMGNVGLKISIGDEKMGVGIIPNLVLKPGNNQYTFKALIEEQSLLKLAMAAGNKTPLKIGSNGTEIGGQKISWLSKPLESMVADVPFEVGH